MAELNQWIGRHVNREDGITGRFWNGRYNRQRLLDSAALSSARGANKGFVETTLGAPCKGEVFR